MRIGVFAPRINHNDNGGVNTLTMDGSVHFTRNEIAVNVWRALGTCTDGEALADNPF